MGFVREMKEKVIKGEDINLEESLKLYKYENYKELYDAANEIREKFVGKVVDLCSIMNAKCGKCSEDCKYCAQSVHYNTEIKAHNLVTAKEALELARENERDGVQRFSLVTSGRALKGQEFEKVLNIYKILKDNSKLKLCASLGILSYEQLLKLKEIGVTQYHHNIETSRRHFQNICTTHSYEDRIVTIKNAQKAGLSVCSGGIIGMGEEFEDRLHMAFELRGLGIKSIPINVLTPIKGTPLEKEKNLSREDILRNIALFRFINKDAHIRLGATNSCIKYRRI